MRYPSRAGAEVQPQVAPHAADLLLVGHSGGHGYARPGRGCCLRRRFGIALLEEDLPAHELHPVADFYERPRVRLDARLEGVQARGQGAQLAFGLTARRVLRGDGVHDRRQVPIQCLDVRLERRGPLVDHLRQGSDLLVELVGPEVDAAVDPLREGQSQAFAHAFRRALRAHSELPFRSVGPAVRTTAAARAPVADRVRV